MNKYIDFSNQYKPFIEMTLNEILAHNFNQMVILGGRCSGKQYIIRKLQKEYLKRKRVIFTENTIIEANESLKRIIKDIIGTDYQVYADEFSGKTYYVLELGGWTDYHNYISKETYDYINSLERE